MTTVALFSGLRSASAKSRATLSVGPPAAKGTTMVIGLSGKACAAAASVAAARAIVSFFIAVSPSWAWDAAMLGKHGAGRDVETT